MNFDLEKMTERKTGYGDRTDAVRLGENLGKHDTDREAKRCGVNGRGTPYKLTEKGQIPPPDLSLVTGG